MAGINFDPNQHQPSQSQDPVPAGWYTAMIIESELTDTADLCGQFYAFVYQIVEGPFAKRKITARYNVKNKNAVAVEIANSDLSALYHAIGAQTEVINETQQLHNRPHEIKLAISPAKGEYSASNQVRGYRAISGNQAAIASSASRPVAPPAFVPPIAPPIAAITLPSVPTAPPAVGSSAAQEKAPWEA